MTGRVFAAGPRSASQGLQRLHRLTADLNFRLQSRAGEIDRRLYLASGQSAADEYENLIETVHNITVRVTESGLPVPKPLFVIVNGIDIALSLRQLVLKFRELIHIIPQGTGVGRLPAAGIAVPIGQALQIASLASSASSLGRSAESLSLMPSASTE